MSDVSSEGLFPADQLTRIPVDQQPTPPAVDKRFAAYDPHAVTLMPEALDDWLPDNHLARLVADLVDTELDLSDFYTSYTATKGRPPYDPRMMVKILIYGYCTGVRSSRKLEVACTDMVTFRWLAAGAAPDFRAFSRFRRRHLHALAGVFTQVLSLCRAAGMVSLGTIALDGTKVNANASRRKAMSYNRLVAAEEQLAGKVADLLAAVEATDADEDTRYGDTRGDELPDELATTTARLAKIRAAKKQIDDEHAAAARAAAQKKSRDDGDDDTTVADKSQAAEDKAVNKGPKPTEQRNFTDPDARIMKQPHGGFDYSYNAQAIVDADNQVIVSTELDNNAADSRTFIPMMTGVFDLAADPDGPGPGGAGGAGGARLVPGECLADAGYCSAENLRFAAQLEKVYGEVGTGFYVATGRLRHGERVPDSPRGPVPEGATGRELMGRRLKTKKGAAVYAKRKKVVEPVFGQIATRQGKHVLLRGLDAARCEWRLIAGCHNVLKLLSFRGRNAAGTLV